MQHCISLTGSVWFDSHAYIAKWSRSKSSAPVAMQSSLGCGPGLSTLRAPAVQRWPRGHRAGTAVPHVLAVLICVSWRAVSILCAYSSFMYLIWGTNIFRYFAHFLIGLFVFLLLSCKAFHIFWMCASHVCIPTCSVCPRPLWELWFTKGFSHSLGCCFTFFMVSFKAHRVLNFDEGHLTSIFPSVAHTFGVIENDMKP